MPVQSWGHSQYWGDSGSTFIPPPPGPSRGGYPGWQAAVVAPSAFGAIGAWWDDWTDWIAGWVRFMRRVHRLPDARRLVLLDVLQALESPIYDHARTAVRQTATTLGFNRPEVWVDYSRAIKGTPRRAENIYRHVRAVDLLQEAWCATQPGSTATRLTNPQKDLYTQLAYAEYARKPWGDA